MNSTAPVRRLHAVQTIERLHHVLSPAEKAEHANAALQGDPGFDDLDKQLQKRGDARLEELGDSRRRAIAAGEEAQRKAEQELACLEELPQETLEQRSARMLEECLENQE